MFARRLHDCVSEV